MFLYSLCHADDLHLALSEAARVTQPGGQLFVYDYVRNAGDNTLAQQLLSAQFHDREALLHDMRRAGWCDPLFFQPARGNDAVFRRMVDGDLMYEQIMHELTPMIWMAWRL
jgi:ubiquinone/menaquinone biosynthesis C-methylase UbiE